MKNLTLHAAIFLALILTLIASFASCAAGDIDEAYEELELSDKSITGESEATLPSSPTLTLHDEKVQTKVSRSATFSQSTSATAVYIAKANNGKCLLPARGAAYPGYKFLGWAKNEEGAKIYKPGEVYSFADPAQSVSLYAQWEEIGLTYTIENEGEKSEEKAIESIEDFAYSEEGTYAFVGKLTKENFETLLKKSAKAKEAIALDFSKTEGLIFTASQGQVNSSTKEWITLCGSDRNGKAQSENNKLTSIVLPDHLQNIPVVAFYNCKALKAVKLGEKTEKIERGAFMGCEALETVDLANVKSIEGNAFYGCKSLKELSIPEETQYLYRTSSETFYNESAIESFTVDEGNWTFESKDGVIYLKDGKTVVTKQ